MSTEQQAPPIGVNAPPYVGTGTLDEGEIDALERALLGKWDRRATIEPGTEQESWLYVVGQFYVSQSPAGVECVEFFDSPELAAGHFDYIVRATIADYGTERVHVETGPAETVTVPREPDLGDLVVVLLAGTLSGLRDRLEADGFPRAAELVAELVETTDNYLG